MRYLNLTWPTSQQNLACDEVLLNRCETSEGEEILRFWEPTAVCVVVGYSNQVRTEVHLDVCQRLNIPVLRRCTGGGAVVQGPGCLNYTLLLRHARTGSFANISTTNHYVMQRHRDALQTLCQRSVRIQGHTDLTLENLKFSGNAQRRRRHSLMFHGVFLLNFDLSLINRLLPLPTRCPDYRENRPHHAFLTNLAQPPSAVRKVLQAAWNAAVPHSLKVDERAMNQLLMEKYANDRWHLRR